MQKLYDSRERNGDVVFVFKRAAGAGDIEVPVPAHQQADVVMRDEGGQDEEIARIKCHRQVLLSQSEYFRGLLQFNNIARAEEAKHETVI